MVHRHVALLTYSALGSRNPSLQLAKNLVKLGVKVTFLTSVSAHGHIAKSHSIPQGLTILSFSDGYDDGVKLSDDLARFRSEFKNRSSKALSHLFTTSTEEGYPVTVLVYTMGLSWAAEVARGFNVPSAALWIQPASVFNMYFHYFNDYGDAIRKICSDPSCSIQLPGLPTITCRDLPTFLLPSNAFGFLVADVKEQLDALDEAAKPIVLVNTYDALETEALRAIGKYNLLSIGPLVPSTSMDGRGPPNTSFGGNLTQKSMDYMEWLDSKPQSSVAYLSFGSVITLSKQQMEEIARGLMESHRPFLWVIRALDLGENQEDKLSNRDELEKQGLIVPWCSQVVVLSHPSLGCFVTHCGWNSTLESLVSGVPAVGIPQFADQPTNAKLIEDTFKSGVRATPNEDGLVEGEEIKRCIELVMGDGEIGEKIRINAKKWKDLAGEAVKDGGSSNVNLRTFVDEIEENLIS
ncbi:unnamed protein product [Thlaspi arvense]|uniref:Glycosyltransferase n=1 Tax=Thlaspi arvense TaxID=13288 RepID=A0AAU9RL50_THLAR|nr:unnamed protein product [Thlaspi arvense]